MSVFLTIQFPKGPDYYGPEDMNCVKSFNCIYFTMIEIQLVTYQRCLSLARVETFLRCFFLGGGETGVPGEDPLDKKPYQVRTPEIKLGRRQW